MAELSPAPWFSDIRKPLGVWLQGRKSCLLAGALMATTCTAPAPHLSGALPPGALESATPLQRLPKQTILGDVAKLEKLPSSQGPDTLEQIGWRERGNNRGIEFSNF